MLKNKHLELGVGLDGTLATRMASNDYRWAIIEVIL